MMDDYRTLFTGTSQKGERQRLFENYVMHSPEGQARAKALAKGAATPEQVWSTLTVEEQTTFLAVTAALGALEDLPGSSLLKWIDRLEEIHGEAQFPKGPRFPNDRAFRLYGRLTPAAARQLESGQSRFRNTCTQRVFDYGGGSLNHDDFCLKFQRPFVTDRKTDNFPNLQFNFTEPSCCVDIDLDYDRVQHMSRDNSNVLARNHTRNRFLREYCDPGFDF